MRVLICGGRDFADYSLLNSELSQIHSETPIDLIIHGDSPGADTLAGKWAAVNQVDVFACPSDWKRYGRRAGPIRNSAMLEHRPDYVVAFPGGRGTADMVKKGKRAGVAVFEVDAAKSTSTVRDSCNCGEGENGEK